MAAVRYYHYDPSLPAAAAFTVLFLATTVLHIYQVVRTKIRYFIPFCVGGIFEIFGFGARAVNAHQTPNWSFPVFVIQSMGILLAPALFAASIYMEFGRIILLVDGEKHSLVKRKWLTKLFVSGDILSFVFQAIGGSILAKQEASSANLGKAIVELGLGFQIIFFGFFIVNVVIFSTRMHKSPTSSQRSTPWVKHVAVLLIAGALILARCIYRIIEYMEGPEGKLMTHEIYLYILDASLMLVVMIIFHFVHPSEVGSLIKGGNVAVLFRVYPIEGKNHRYQLNMAQREANVFPAA